MVEKKEKAKWKIPIKSKLRSLNKNSVKATTYEWVGQRKLYDIIDPVSTGPIKRKS